MPHRAAPPSPRIVTRWALRVTCVASTATALLLLAWITWGHEHLADRRVSAVMVYLLVLAVALGSAIVAAVGTCFTAVHKAFSAGYQTGLQVGAATEAGRPHGGPNGGGHLRLVERDG